MHARHLTKIQRGLCTVHGCNRKSKKNGLICAQHEFEAQQLDLPLRRKSRKPLVY